MGYKGHNLKNDPNVCECGFRHDQDSDKISSHLADVLKHRVRTVKAGRPLPQTTQDDDPAVKFDRFTTLTRNVLKVRKTDVPTTKNQSRTK